MKIVAIVVAVRPRLFSRRQVAPGRKSAASARAPGPESSARGAAVRFHALAGVQESAPLHALAVLRSPLLGGRGCPCLHHARGATPCRGVCVCVTVLLTVLRYGVCVCVFFVSIALANRLTNANTPACSRGRVAPTRPSVLGPFDTGSAKVCVCVCVCLCPTYVHVGEPPTWCLCFRCFGLSYIRTYTHVACFPSQV